MGDAVSLGLGRLSLKTVCGRVMYLFQEGHEPGRRL